MAVAWNDSNCESSFKPCNCYKVASLTETILGSTQTSNLKDQYVLGDQLGWGQFGVIRACSDKFTGEVLACKSISKDFVHLVMELCAGGELFHQLEKNGKFSEGEARVIFRQLMQVVKYCHDKGVIHRDLKPENILLATKASSSPIKLADFGLATYIKPGQKLHGTVGSPFYIAPEVLAGGYNQAADVWSAGVILYILLSGRPPFWGKTKSRIFDAVRAADLRFWSDPWDNISDSAKKLIREMLCTDPSQRLTAQQVLDHAWSKDLTVLSEEPFINDKQSFGGLDAGGGSFSASFMTRNEDISFGTAAPVIFNSKSPAQTCKSSLLSSFIVEPSMPLSESGGFSFHSSSGGSNTLEFSTTVLSLPSFAFFSPDPVSEQGNFEMEFSANICRVDSVHREGSSKKLFVLPGSSPFFGHEARDSKSTGGTSGSRMSSIPSKRNRTISLGEFEQVNLMATESVIRWASCTHLPTPASLRSSLVC